MTHLDILHRYWGYASFRGIQQQIIESIAQGKDTLGLMPTGGGKSITFQVPALAQEGVCLVITPLISLMKDQVDHLREKGIQAAAIYSGMSRANVVQTLENAIFGGVKLLYISPERLASDLFQAKLKHMKVSFITVDEAHCISQWGYDFRPSYLAIADVRKIVPDVPVLALTATATPDVIEDIQARLLFKEPNVFRMSFARNNLSYIVKSVQDKPGELLHLLQIIPGSAIVYVRSRKKTKDIAQYLLQHNISATWYHAGLDPVEKDARQTSWQKDEIRVIVATNAFGMGIDKPDVTMVVHIDTPSSIEAYFQEAGRAGRDGNPASAILLFNGHDASQLRKRIDDTFPDKEFIVTIYNHLAYFYQIGVNSGYNKTFEFPIDKFCFIFHHFPIRVNAALEILSRAGYILYDADPNTRARVKFLLSRNELYRVEQSSPQENAVIISLLRRYAGLFVDYAYIDEAFIAHDVELSKDETYRILIGLSKKRIIDFIPRRNIPLITYLTDRVDGEEIVLSKDVYDDRKREFAKRIQSVIAYARNNGECRSSQLLAYFGETDAHPCGHCDVCMNHNPAYMSDDQLEPIKQTILSMLSDGEGHCVTELRNIPQQSEFISRALNDLLDDEQVVMDGSTIFLR